jgi:hypothetical protein
VLRPSTKEGVTNVKVTPRTEETAKKLSERKVMPPGWRIARINSAAPKLTKKKGEEMIELELLVKDSDGNERLLRDWLTDNALGSQKLLHVVEAVGAKAKYDAGEISHTDFPGHDVGVRLAIKKQRLFPDTNEVIDYRSADSSVVSLRTA